MPVILHGDGPHELYAGTAGRGQVTSFRTSSIGKNSTSRTFGSWDRLPLQEAYARFGRPDIVNTDQGSQFTAQEFVDAVIGYGVQLSMDGRGAWRDNVFFERAWRSIKYERVYLRAYDSVSDARTDIAQYISWYNSERGLQVLVTKRQSRFGSRTCSLYERLYKM